MSVMMTTSVNARDVVHVLEATERALDTGSMMRFLRSKVHPWWRDATVERFAHEGDVGTGTGLFGGWAELSPATVRIREAQGHDGESPINVRDGGMFDAIMTSYDLFPEAAGGTIVIPGSGLDPITAEKIHTAQRGKSGNAINGFGDTPPRPVLNLSTQNMEEVLVLLGTHLAAEISGGLI